MGAVRLVDVKLTLGSFTLGPINTSFGDKSYSVVIGPTGSGKSTLLRVIAGLHRLNAGRVIIDDVDVTETPPERRGISYVPQGYALFDHMDVFGNIEYGLRVRGVPKAERVREVYRIADELGIRHLLRRSVRGLSGGESQKVALARALVVRPRVLLLDEPMSMIDIATRDELILTLRKIPKTYGTTVIHVTHDRDEAYSLADKVLVLNNGMVVEEGDPEEVFNRPKTVFTARFVGFNNIIDSTATPLNDGSSVVRIGEFELRSIERVDGDVYVCIRAEWFSETEGVQDNILVGRVVDIVRVRLGYMTTIDIGGVNLQVLLGRRVSLGDVVRVAVRPDRVHLIPKKAS